jgi:hypothetical protein
MVQYVALQSEVAGKSGLLAEKNCLLAIKT